MPSPLTSSFASAAAGNTQDSHTSRREGSGAGEWSRSRTNGATQTFRRPSLATNNSHTRESTPSSSANPSSNTGAYIPPHHNSTYQSTPYRNGVASDTRYSKEQMLAIFRQMREAGNLDNHLAQVFRGSWDPTEPRDSTVSSSWGKDSKDQSIGPEVCWEPEPKNLPLTLTEMTEAEKEIFSTSVNSPLKAPTNKDSTPGAGNRKTSISQNGPYGASPHSGRPGTRRRETVDSSTGGNPLSPTGNSRFFRDEPSTSTPPAALLRRKTDLKDSPPEMKSAMKEKDDGGRDTTAETSSPFDSFRRRPTGGPLSAGLNAPESPWSAGPRSATFGGGMGAFGSFSLGAGAGSGDTLEKDKRPGFGSMRGESRFKGLLAKTSSEDIVSGSTPEKSSKGNLERLAEDEDNDKRPSWEAANKSRQMRSGTNPYDDDASHGGSVGFDTDPRSQLPSEVGFSSLGDTTRNSIPSHQTPQSRQYGYDTTSPANPNPYQNLEGDQHVLGEDGQESLESRRTNLSALGSLREDSSAETFGSIRAKNVPSGFDDRSQTSSTGPNRGFSAFGGLGGLPNVGGPSPWSANPIAPIGTPTKDRPGYPAPFGDSIFGSMSDLQSPSIGSGFGNFARSSKMGPLFPQVMQDQMRDDRGRPSSAEEAFKRESELGRPDQSHDMARGGSNDSSAQDSGFTHPQSSNFAQGGSAPGSGAMANVGPADSQQHQNQSSENANQLPTPQQRQMVMPDRMRWIYRDPQGNTQGPWSGLEMHDWFKAGFFTAELQVRKLEDPEFEPLAQLVRRIGNSREPFLVPQIGIPHGPAPPSQANPWATGASVSGGVPQGSGTQPPFANSFPSFGTTLTAEQQNALERRKQEEQYLMARQKEHLAHQQAMLKQMAIPGAQNFQHGLQHHSSAHSLHSQPSFGSITSPSGYQPSPIQGPTQPPPPMGGFPEPGRHLPQVGMGRGDLDELPAFFERVNVNRGGQHPFVPGPFGGRAPEGPHQQAISNILQDRARLQAEQQEHMKLTGEALPGFQSDSRLQEFNQLIGKTDDISGAGLGLGPSSVPIGGTRPRPDDPAKHIHQAEPTNIPAEKEESPEPEMLSLSKQAKDVAASQHQAPASAWQNKAEAAQPIVPPPQPASPLPAPAAQRRQNVADTLVAESRSQTQTPVDTPSASIAPWADKTTELPKGPSLKEIQEAEAKKAAEREELAAAARRAQAELERQQAANIPAPAPGLPSSSTWADTTSPATPTGPSVWSKNAPAKAVVATPVVAKRTLAQIQKEEELRKQRAANNAAAQATSSNTSVTGGKRYAELVGKAAPVAPTGPAAASGAWTTVGSGGKVKAPATVVAAPGLAQRKTSGLVTPQTASRPATTRAPSSAIAAQPTQANKAQEELVKWAKGQLAKGLSSGINADEFVDMLLTFPADVEIISESVHASSKTLNSRPFAEEFVRKRKLADKGIVDGTGQNASSSAATEAKSGGNGWSEVAKKGPEKKDEAASNTAFKVVAGKKKTRK